MALTPWGLVAAAVCFHAAGRIDRFEDPATIAQVSALAVALVVGSMQVRVRLSGSAGRQPGRARWGSVLVAGTVFATTTSVAIASRPLPALFDRLPAPVSSAGGRIERGDYGAPRLLGHLENPAIIESSGLAASIIDPGRLWTHNDSANAPVVYCIELDGRACGEVTVTNAIARDWEDIAVGPGPDESLIYLYVGDIGDNAISEETITIYRFPEPQPGADRSIDVEAQAIRLSYPDGPHDAETLLVHPRTGDLYIVTKEEVSGVYKASPPFTTDSTMMLDRVAQFSIFDTLSDRTGGAISPDGRRVVVSTYVNAFEFVLPDGEAMFDAIWSQEPLRVPIGPLSQAEGITYSVDGREIIATEEGLGAPIYQVEFTGSMR